MNGSVDLTQRKAEALVTEALEVTRVFTLNGGTDAISGDSLAAGAGR